MFNNPHFFNNHKENPILNVQDFVAWKKANNNYNFQSLPKTAILSIFSYKKPFLSLPRQKRIKGIKGDNFIINNAIILCTGCSNGAPAIITLCEELRALGVSEFIFIGVAGVLCPKIKESEILYVEKAFSGTGTSYYYSKEEVLKAEHPFTFIPEQLNLKKVSSWSTDAPFRETPSLKEYYYNKGATVVEMETAAIYAFANYYNLKSACFVITADSIYNGWTPPENLKKINNTGAFFLKKTLTILTK